MTPIESVACFEVADGARLVATLERLKLVERLLTLPGFDAYLETPDGIQIPQGLHYLETRFQRPPIELARAVLAGRWIIAAVPNGDGIGVRPVLIARPENPTVVRDLLSVVVAFAQGTPRKLDDTPSVRVGNSVYFWIDDTFVLGAADRPGTRALRAVRD